MTASRPPAVSVIVCTRDRASRLESTLETLAAMRVATDVAWDVLVVDNASTDRTPAVVDAFRGRLPVRRVVEERTGLSHARNRGVAEARGDVLVWIDDDVDVPVGWLDAWVAGFRAFPDAGFFGSDIEVRFEVEPPSWVSAGWDRLGSLFAERRMPEAGAEVAADYLPFGANFAVRAALQREHPYDPTYGRVGSGMAGGEETTVLERWIEEGHEGRWIGGAGLVHVLGAERWELPRLRRQVRLGAALLQPEPRVSPDGPPTSTGAIRRLWLLAEIRWRLARTFSDPERWVDAFVSAATWRGHLDRRSGRRAE